MKCPFCQLKILPVNGVYGWMYKCHPCNASVGCHPNTKNPLGTMAKPELRKLRSEAHRVFDPLWKAKIKRDNCTKKEARQSAYRWLSTQLNIDYKACHIGLFQDDLCLKTIEICKEYYR